MNLDDTIPKFDPMRRAMMMQKAEALPKLCARCSKFPRLKHIRVEDGLCAQCCADDAQKNAERAVKEFEGKSIRERLDKAADLESVHTGEPAPTTIRILDASIVCETVSESIFQLKGFKHWTKSLTDGMYTVSFELQLHPTEDPEAIVEEWRKSVNGKIGSFNVKMEAPWMSRAWVELGGL